MSGFTIALFAGIGILFVFIKSGGEGVVIISTVAIIGLGAYAIIRGYSK